jgi:hypothetical protein
VQSIWQHCHGIVDARLDDPFMMQRLEFLREKANEGTLTEQERAEYEGFVEGNDLLMLIKDQARSMLQNGAIYLSVAPFFCPSRE